MIGSLRKHQSWIWIIAIPVVIVSLVSFYSSGGGGGSGGGISVGSINGRPIKRDEYASAQKLAALQSLLRTGQVPRDGQDLRQEVFDRILVEEAIRHYRIEVSSEVTAKFLRNMLVGENATLDLATYQKILANIGTKIAGLTDQDMDRYARTEVGRLHLAAIFGGPGSLVSQAEVEDNFRRAHEEMIVEAAVVSGTNFLAEVQADAASVSNYFSLNQSFYRQPEQRSANYVFFPLTNFFAEADAKIAKQGTNMAAIVENQFTQMGTNSLIEPLTGRQMTKAEALERIRTEFRGSIAGSEARIAAAKLINEVYEAQNEGPYVAGLFEKKAEAAKLPLMSTLPFEASVGPLGVSAEGFSEATFALSPDKPYSLRPLASDKGVYVVLLKQVVPARLLPFETVRTQVIADFKREESLKLARNAGEKFASTLTNTTSVVKGFAAAAKAAGLTVVPLPKFSLATQSLPESPLPVDIRLLKGYTSGLKVGASTAFVPLQDGGVVMHLVSKQAVDPAKLKEELPAYGQRFREQRVYYSFREWLNRQATELKLVVPQS